MKNLGIGTDIEEISRFRKLGRIKNRQFLENIYTKKELDYCYSKKNTGQHLAARFAGKEAILKALTSIGLKYTEYKDIEIVNAASGVPKAMIKKVKNFDVKISLSHCKDKALAFALVIKK